MKKAHCAAGIFGMGQNGYLAFRHHSRPTGSTILLDTSVTVAVTISIDFVLSNLGQTALLDTAGNLVVYVREKVLTSERATTAVYAHEGLEAEELMYAFRENAGSMSYKKFNDLVRNNQPGNLHNDARDLG